MRYHPKSNIGHRYNNLEKIIMLSLTRKSGESTFIFDEEGKKMIEIVLTYSRNGMAKLSFAADKKYTILREEVYKRNYEGENISNLPV